MSWNDLDEEQQNELAQMMLKGTKPTPDNLNRARNALSTNETLLGRLMKEAGMEGAGENVDEAQTSGQDIMARLMSDQEDPDSQRVAQAGAHNAVDQGDPSEVDDSGQHVPNEGQTNEEGMPTPMKGESAEEYYARLMMSMEQSAQEAQVNGRR